MLYRRLLMKQNKKIQEYKTKYLTFIALENGFQVQNSTFDLEYCINASDTWVSLSSGTYSPSINSGHIISFRANISPIDHFNWDLISDNFRGGCGIFSTNKDFEICGDPLSLTEGDNAPSARRYPSYAFEYMFALNTHLKRIHSGFFRNLTSSLYCFAGMFTACTGLISVPSDLLPMDNTSSFCYNYMFSNCTNLTNVPLLPSTSVTTYCYKSMFKGCKSLISLPSGLLPATKLATECYREMFVDCIGLTTVPSDLLPATTLANHCYNNMFSGCTSLTKAPDLPAPNVYTYTQEYYKMFYGCSKLNYVKMLATTIDTDTFGNWLYGVASSGTFVKSASITLPTGASGIPSGWTVQNV